MEETRESALIKKYLAGDEKSLEILIRQTHSSGFLWGSGGRQFQGCGRRGGMGGGGMGGRTGGEIISKELSQLVSKP